MMLTFLLMYSIKRITIIDPSSTSESTKHMKQEMLISNKVRNNLMLAADPEFVVLLHLLLYY